jgi:Ca2+-binding EF-hand superfamily protein
VWLQALQRLLKRVGICGVYASGKTKDTLVYPGFAAKWKEYAGDSGYIDKARVKDFLTDLMVDKTTGDARGIWYEAYVTSLEKLDMTLKTQTMLDLFQNEFDADKDGFLQVEEFDQILRFICSRGIWEKAYLQFLEDAKIELPEQVLEKFWNYLNEGEKNPGLVPMPKLLAELEKMVMSSGLLPSQLSVMMSLIGVKVPENELGFIHQKFDTNFTGFMPFGDFFALLDKVGRHGMPFSRFRTSVQALGLKVDEHVLYQIFSELDVNQDAQLDWCEFRGGYLMIVKDQLPEAIRVKLGMSDMDVLTSVVGVIVGMTTLFAFILLALQSFGGGKKLMASIQSSFATAITMGANSESSGGLDLDKYRATVSTMVAVAMGLNSLPK